MTASPPPSFHHVHGSPRVVRGDRTPSFLGFSFDPQGCGHDPLLDFHDFVDPTVNERLVCARWPLGIFFAKARFLDLSFAAGPQFISLPTSEHVRLSF